MFMYNRTLSEENLLNTFYGQLVVSVEVGANCSTSTLLTHTE